MWVQQEVAAGRIQIVKVKGKNSPADILTKHIDNDRHEMAPHVAQDDSGKGN